MSEPQGQEEELSITGSDPVKPTSNQLEQDTPVNMMGDVHADLSALIKPGSSNEEFIDTLLSVSPEQLIPWEECYLPSGGIYYGWPDGICHVKPMGQTAEKILATQRLAASGQSIDYLFRECCKFPDGFDPNDLLLGDRVFLLYFLRGITHGNMYEFAVTCPSCDVVNTHSYDLNNLALTIKKADLSLGAEPFRIDLPYISGVFKRDVWVGVRFLRAYDANDMIARRKSRKKTFAKPGGVKPKTIAQQRAAEAADPRMQQRQNVIFDNALDDNLEKVIVSVNGIVDRMKVRQFIQKLHAQDTATIREWLKVSTPGIENTVEIICPDCSSEFTVELPITENFFRPSKK